MARRAGCENDCVDIPNCILFVGLDNAVALMATAFTLAIKTIGRQLTLSFAFLLVINRNHGSFDFDVDTIQIVKGSRNLKPPPTPERAKNKGR